MMPPALPVHRILGLTFLASLGLAACQSRSSLKGSKAKGSQADSVALALEAVVRSGRGLPGPSPTTADRDQLGRLYALSAHNPLWLTPKGNLRSIGNAALQRLGNAASDGLRPEDSAKNMVDEYSSGSRDQHAPIAIEGQNCQGTEHMKMSFNSAAR